MTLAPPVEGPSSDEARGSYRRVTVTECRAGAVGEHRRRTRIEQQVERISVDGHPDAWVVGRRVARAVDLERERDGSASTRQGSIVREHGEHSAGIVEDPDPVRKPGCSEKSILD